MEIAMVGVDCAVDTRNVGVAFGDWNGRRGRVLDVLPGASLGRSHGELADAIGERLDVRAPALIALDAPLGWPTSLGRALVEHRAGSPLKPTPDALFRRETDRDVHLRLKRKPLDVGADRIARTARAALALLEHLRRRTGKSIPLARSPHIEGFAAIEVYPAGTLKAHGLPDRAYKTSSQRHTREILLQGLRRYLDVRGRDALLLDRPDCLDAVVCLLAAVDFFLGKSRGPADAKLAEREGWIWVADPEPR